MKWHVKFNNGKTAKGCCDDQSWLSIQQKIDDEKISMSSMWLSNDKENTIFDIDKGADGYFMAQKVVAALHSSSSVHMIGIGYWKKNNPIRIKWYDAKTMMLVQVETRSKSEGGQFLVLNR